MNTSNIKLYYKKYIKYKNKYINLVNKLKGGGIEWYYWSSTNNDWKKIEGELLEKLENSYNEPKIINDFVKNIKGNKIKASDNTFRPIYRKNTDSKELDKKGEWLRWDYENNEWIFLEELSDLIENKYIKNYPIFEQKSPDKTYYIDFDKMILTINILDKNTTYPLIRKIEKKMSENTDLSPVIHVYSFPIKDNKTPLRVNKDTKFRGTVDYGMIPNELLKMNPTSPRSVSISSNITSKDYLNIKYSDIYSKLNPKTSARDINIDYDDSILKEFLNNLQNVTKKQFEHLFKLIGTTNIMLLNQSEIIGYINKVTQLENEKVIIFGDYHGSFHTFYRNMIRLHISGVLDIKTLKINEGYRIIFLGDIVDRGGYSIEILNFIFMLIINNDIEKILINRGNHEVYDIYTNYGFSDEINKKLKENNEKYLNLIKTFFNLCSTAIILINGDYKYWLCHGCIPCDDPIFEGILNNFLKSKDKILMLRDANIVNQIRWNDATMSNENRDMNRESKCIPNPRGDKIYIISEQQFKKYLKMFNFIIRAHQDNFSNAWIVGKDGWYDIGLIEGEQSLYEDKPIKSIKIDDYEWLNTRRLYKIMTISTNTGADRSLYNDGFIMISPNGEALPSVSSIPKEKQIDWIDDYDFKI